jgi:hypothetical protein
MIVNRQLLELMGVCGESLEHFTNVVGVGDINFQMSLDDSVRYLRELETSDPETYRGWADLVDGFKTDQKYIKAAAGYTYGEYVLIGYAGETYPTVESARNARDLKHNELYSQEKNNFIDQFYVSAIVCVSGGETLQKTEAEIAGCEYLVFHPSNGVHERFASFDSAKTRLVEIEHEVLEPRCVVRIGRQIIVDGEVAAIDVVEDA